ncbi:MAG: ATP-dependent helicase RecG [Campylobacterota bacterium]|nr:ATP-dependent helicase RecG [Campylobacterota bacterium]
MCRFSPFGRTKGHPEGNCEVIISHEIQKVNKVSNIKELGDFFDIEFVRPQIVKTEGKVSDTDDYGDTATDYDRLRPIVPNYDQLQIEEKKILNYILDNEKITKKEALNLTGYGETKTKEILGVLVEKNLIARDGQGRSTHYKLIESAK